MFCVTLCKVKDYQLFSKPPSQRTTHCRFSVSAYSIYSQLPSVPGVRLLHPQPENEPCRGEDSSLVK
jgi:hypothetical protein